MADNTPTTIDTPCIKVCVVEPSTGLCSGCGRSLMEIGGWGAFTTEQRRALMAELPARIASVQAISARRCAGS